MAKALSLLKTNLASHCNQMLLSYASRTLFPAERRNVESADALNNFSTLPIFPSQLI